MKIRKRPGMYLKNISAKRKKYVDLGLCIDCGKKSETFRCSDCNNKRSEYCRAWRKKNKENHALKQKEWRAKNKDKVRANNRKARAKGYGLTASEYELMIKMPCGICGSTTKKRCVDHCHYSLVVRGCLCSSCNSMLGWYEANAERISSWLKQKTTG